jgi:UDP-N-acetylglucosamine 2-epimerase (non-hydrolysing)
LRENVPAERILVTGNPGIDALRWITSLPENQTVHDLLLETAEARVLLVTAHRRENFGQPLHDICLALRDIAQRYEGSVRIIYPVHRNPNVWGPVHEVLGDVPHIRLREPLDYVSNLHLMRRAYLVVTDSGGIQEEATGLGIPALVLREVTERPEGVETGALRLVGTSRQRIVAEVQRLLDDPTEYERMAQAENPFGDGHAAERIVASLLE